MSRRCPRAPQAAGREKQAWYFRFFTRLTAACLVGASTVPAAESKKPRERAFRFDYSFSLTGLTPGRKLRVWMPVPQSGEYQTVKRLPMNLPGNVRQGVESKYGNRMLLVEAVVPADGQLEFKAPYSITRREVRYDSSVGRTKLTRQQRRLFLDANRNVPVSGKPLALLKNLKLPVDPIAKARRLYDRVDEHVRYDKSGTGWGRGDANWVCDSRYGNCTDFHSLFISLARAQNIPARFEIGFPVPLGESGKVGGYHCWGWFYADERGWLPVDISEADKNPRLKEYYFGSLTADRVAFTVGRDIDLTPRQNGPPLNFFVYPHVEVDGEPLSADAAKKHVQLKFAFRNQ